MTANNHYKKPSPKQKKKHGGSEKSQYKNLKMRKETSLYDFQEGNKRNFRQCYHVV